MTRSSTLIVFPKSSMGKNRLKETARIDGGLEITVDRLALTFRLQFGQCHLSLVSNGVSAVNKSRQFERLSSVSKSVAKRDRFCGVVVFLKGRRGRDDGGGDCRGVKREEEEEGGGGGG